MFNVEHRIFAAQPMAATMKWINFWMHCAVCCLVMEILKRLLNNVDGQVIFLTTLMFAIHPIHTEAVSGIVGRADLMCTLFYLLTILVYLRFARVHERGNHLQAFVWLTGLFALTIIATLCKELGVTVLVNTISHRGFSVHTV